MSPDEKKRAVARAAIEQIGPGVVLGIGTGSTANYFIEALTEVRSRIDVTVASSPFGRFTGCCVPMVSFF